MKEKKTFRLVASTVIVLVLIVLIGVSSVDGHRGKNKHSKHFPPYEMTPLELIQTPFILPTPSESNQITWNISPLIIKKSSDTLTITLNTSNSTLSPKDQPTYLCLYSPQPQNYSNAVPIKLFPVLHYPQTFSISLLNLRAPYSFSIISGNWNSPQKILSIASQTVSFLNYLEPLQPHLSLNSKSPYSLTLTWNTKNYSIDQKSLPRVQYSLSPLKHFNHIAYDKNPPFTYTQSQMCGGTAKNQGWRDPGVFHTAILTDLIPGKIYDYYFGDEISGFSDVFHFTAPAEVGMDTAVIIYGDLGQHTSDGSQEVDIQPGALGTLHYLKRDILSPNNNNNYKNSNEISLLPSNKIFSDLRFTGILHIVDIAYARGYSCLWDEFMHDISPISSSVPYMTAIGNHEMDWPNSTSLYQGYDSGGECGIPYGTRFSSNFLNSSSQNNNPKNYYYSFDFGRVHYLIISTEHNSSVGSPQYNFILSDLRFNFERKIKNEIDWIIVTGHRPMYVDSDWSGDQQGAQYLRSTVEPLFRQYRVDLAFWGHHHSYQLSCIAFGGKCVAQGNENEDWGTVNVIVGAAGEWLTPKLEKSIPEWALFVENKEYGYGRMRIGKQEIEFEFVTDNEGMVVDRWALRHEGKWNRLIRGKDELIV